MNKFFSKQDIKVNRIGTFKIPNEWWSRPFEYAFAMNYLNKTDTILDVGCGIEHPFKFYASQKVKRVYAIDVDVRIKEINDTNKLTLINDNIININNHFSENFLDKVFLISILSKVQFEAIKILKEIRQVLKDDGKIIITADYPNLKPNYLIEMVKESGLKFEITPDYREGENDLTSPYGNMKCYSAVLIK